MDALVVEDGSGKSNADAYCSIVTADTYHANRGNAAWASATDDQKTAAIRNATAYIDATYTFKGTKVHLNQPTQALLWPRWGIRDDEHVVWDNVWPIPRLVAATCEAALRALSTPLIKDEQDAQIIEQTVGPITQKFGAARNAGQVRIPAVGRQLAPFLVAGYGGLRIARG
jgi:hypothetical protein